MAHRLTMAGGREACVFESAAAIFAFMAGSFRDIAKEAIDRSGRFAAALSGGRTPIGLYREIAGLKEEIDWEKVHIFLVDERLVPLYDDRSNFGMIKDTLLDPVALPPGRAHPVPTGEKDPRACAERYEEEVRAFFGAGPGAIPRFDLVTLGMGEDGHTASLFPGLPVLHEKARLAAAVEPGPGREGRVTLTLPVLNGARQAVFLVVGKAKARAVRQVLVEEDAGLPASLVRPGPGALSFLLDREAASGIGVLSHQEG